MKNLTKINSATTIAEASPDCHEDPDYSAKDDHFSDPVAERDRVYESCKRAGLSDEEIKLLFPSLN